MATALFVTLEGGVESSRVLTLFFYYMRYVIELHELYQDGSSKKSIIAEVLNSVFAYKICILLREDEKRKNVLYLVRHLTSE